MLEKVVLYEMIVNKLNLFEIYDDHLYNVTIINNYLITLSHTLTLQRILFLFSVLMFNTPV